eukprot:TRINITY_DN10727_c0_g1_i14.p1 TRINITY_DN10727_c0_g1~~TRINITY_DN10727_c0_g1_i14.p1  ORF type:complete len:282 (-),score=61.80 TRINITY_DN10727_c0_g1_i14:50-799(-)
MGEKQIVFDKMYLRKMSIYPIILNFFVDMGNSSSSENQDVQQLIDKLVQSPQSTPRVLEKLLKGRLTDPSLPGTLMQLLLGSKSYEAVLKKLSAIKIPGALCGKSISALSFVWACSTCDRKKNDSCFACYCDDCFIKEYHEGHNYDYHLGSDTATCDCGDDEWLDPKSFCSAHKKSAESVDLETMLPLYNKNVTPKLINALQKYTHSVLVGFTSDNNNFVVELFLLFNKLISFTQAFTCLLYTSDAADE